MKHQHPILALIFVGILAASLVWAQKEGLKKEVKEGILDLKSSEFGQPQRPPVKFDHYLHETNVRCRVCHHETNVFSNAKLLKSNKCSSCHKREINKDVPVALMNAFHQKCKGCHKNYDEWDRPAGPVMCGQCHVRQ